MSSSTGHNQDPFPTKQIAVIGLCRVAEPIAFTSILAYSFVMVQQLNGSDRDASFYAGLLVSAFAIGEMSTVMFWGWLSDRIGRKPIVLLGLAGTALSSLIFGFAKNYWVALFARLLGGLLNGNVAVMQTMVAEMVKNPAHEPRAYAVQPFMWSLGSIFGSAMGGFLAQPVKYYPSLFSADGIFAEYPYLLPNLVAAIMIFLAIVQGALLLEETNPLVKCAKVQDHESSDPVTERTPLQPRKRQSSVVESVMSSIRRPSIMSQPRKRQASVVESVMSSVRRPSIMSGALPPLLDPTFEVERPTAGAVRPEMSNLESHPEEESDPSELHLPKAFTAGVLLWVLAITLFSYHQMASGTIFPIWLLDKPGKTEGFDLSGGFNYTVHDVGVFMSANGLIALVVQAVIFPPFVEKVGVWRTTVLISILYPFTYAAPPFLSLLPSNIVPAGIFLVQGLQIFCHVLYFPCALILLKSATPSMLVLGKVNGLAMSAACAARVVASPLAGLTYSTAGSAAAWWTCSAIAIVGVTELYWLPREGGQDSSALNETDTSTA